MPEESSTPNPPAGRRRNAQEESGGGGKVLPIVLGLIILGLGYALYKRSGGDTSQIQNYTNQIAGLTATNLELVTRLTQATNNASLAQSNLHAMLDRRTAELMSFSNRLVQTRQQLEREEAALVAARGDVSAKATSLGTLEAQRDECQRQAAVIPALELEVAAQKAKHNKVLFDYVALQETFGRVSLDKADLERKLQDPLFLRRQAVRVEQAAELRQRAAANQPIKIADPRLILDLQPDGTVRPAITSSTSPKKEPPR